MLKKETKFEETLMLKNKRKIMESLLLKKGRKIDKFKIGEIISKISSASAKVMEVYKKVNQG